MPGRATALTCTLQERQAASAGGKLHLPAVCKAPCGCVYPSKYWQPHWGEQMSGSLWPPLLARCLSAAATGSLYWCHSWWHLFTHTRAKMFLKIVLEHNVVFFFITHHEQPKLDSQKDSVLVEFIVWTGSSGCHLLLMCFEWRHNKMARSVQECHKCLSEGKGASINTSCFFPWQERKGKQRFEDVSGNGEAQGQRDGLKTRIIPGGPWWSLNTSQDDKMYICSFNPTN